MDEGMKNRTWQEFDDYRKMVAMPPDRTSPLLEVLSLLARRVDALEAKTLEEPQAVRCPSCGRLHRNEPTLCRDCEAMDYGEPPVIPIQESREESLRSTGETCRHEWMATGYSRGMVGTSDPLRWAAVCLFCEELSWQTPTTISPSGSERSLNDEA